MFVLLDAEGSAAVQYAETHDPGVEHQRYRACQCCCRAVQGSVHA
jgi:hypothetical protein